MNIKPALRVVLAVAMMAVGVTHFVDPAPFVKIVPAALPEPLALVPRARRAAAWGLVALYVAVFPANLNMALHHISFDDAHPIPTVALWARLPLQALLIALAYWMSRAEPPAP
jgi:uncharacterized membrane protein